MATNRTGDETLDGCAIFVKENKFRVLSTHPIEYFKSDDEVLDRHNVALAIVVEAKDADGPPFVVANTHLLFNPGVCCASTSSCIDWILTGVVWM